MLRRTIDFGAFSVDLINEWSQLKGRYNWIEAHYLMLRSEQDKLHGGFEIEIYLLGFGVRIYWTYNKRIAEEKVNQYKEMIEKGEWVTLKEDDK